MRNEIFIIKTGEDTLRIVTNEYRTHLMGRIFSFSFLLLFIAMDDKKAHSISIPSTYLQ